MVEALITNFPIDTAPEPKESSEQLAFFERA